MRRAVTTALTLVALTAGLLAGGAPAHAADELPVDHNFLLGALRGGVDVTGDAPGTNDWECVPTAEHPRPVVLVHGTFGNRSTNWQTYGPLLKNEGYCVFALTYGVTTPGMPLFGGLGDMRDSAEELRRFVERVLRRTGADEVDIVGHSQGTYMPQYYVKHLGGADDIRNYVSLAPLWHGTRLVDPFGLFARVFGQRVEDLPLCPGCGQMAPDSEFNQSLHRGGLAVPGVRYTNIMTRYDQLVVPWHSGRADGMRNVVLQDVCATDFTEHFEIAADPVAAQIVLNTLDPDDAGPVPCPVVLPFTGPLG